eukprot:CAMPEP_0184313996 /NCGR_PEP_ID=MMETSP1049-20130417/69984_1 /TAXON_ID=77928 /ORGANISM="Proteomonas sulcata, Strain CCMP704" /LENGTH=92 /DNA_ID=CAMNT_0026631663 /DNA_START=256 /DNA_END=534 /DNA_ORIENTATION=-
MPEPSNLNHESATLPTQSSQKPQPVPFSPHPKPQTLKLEPKFEVQHPDSRTKNSQPEILTLWALHKMVNTWHPPASGILNAEPKPEHPGLRR